MASIEPIKHRTVHSTAADGRRTTKRVTLPKRDWRWRARYRDPGGRSRSRTFVRKTDAERFLHENGADLNRGEWVDPRLRRTAFRSWAEEWRATTVRLAPTTRRSYNVLLDNHVLPWFGDRPQASIDYLEVERFIAAKLSDGLSPKRVRAAVSVLSLVMRMIVRAGARKDNPAAGHVIAHRRRKLQPGDALTMDDVTRLASKTREPYHLAVWLMALLGLRPSELCGLRVRSVDFVRSTVTVRETLTPVHSFPGFEYQLAVGPPKIEAGERTLPIPRWLGDELAVMLATSSPAARRNSIPSAVSQERAIDGTEPRRLAVSEQVDQQVVVDDERH
jgi:integrase